MFRLHALGGVGVVAVQVALLAPATVANAQSGEKVLPPVTVEAPFACVTQRSHRSDHTSKIKATWELYR